MTFKSSGTAKEVLGTDDSSKLTLANGRALAVGSARRRRDYDHWARPERVEEKARDEKEVQENQELEQEPKRREYLPQYQDQIVILPTTYYHQ